MGTEDPRLLVAGHDMRVRTMKERLGGPVSAELFMAAPARKPRRQIGLCGPVAMQPFRGDEYRRFPGRRRHNQRVAISTARPLRGKARRSRIDVRRIGRARTARPAYLTKELSWMIGSSTDSTRYVLPGPDVVPDATSPLPARLRHSSLSLWVGRSVLIALSWCRLRKKPVSHPRQMAFLLRFFLEVGAQPQQRLVVRAADGLSVDLQKLCNLRDVLVLII